MAQSGPSDVKRLIEDVGGLQLFPRTVQVLKKLDAALEQLEWASEQQDLDQMHAGIAIAREARDSLRVILGEEEPRLRQVESSLQACRRVADASEFPDVDPDE